MPRTPVLERPTSLRVLGLVFIALVLLFVWVTYAFFGKVFVSSVPITVQASTTGLQLPKYADVKLRGMIVGEVNEIVPAEDGVELKIGLKPEMVDKIPSNVSARLLPKTLFGEKYVSLDVEGEASTQTINEGDVIRGATVPIETEKLLNDLYPLLQAINPEDLSYTLTAVADTLEGRGDEFGASLETLNAYLSEFNPDVPLLIEDLVKLGHVADIYGDAMPDLGDLLANFTVTGQTVTQKRAELASFLKEGSALSGTLSTFLEDNETVLTKLPSEALPVVRVLSQYSGTFPCVLKGIATMTPRLDSVYRDRMVHIDLELLGANNQPTGYTADEKPVMPDDDFVDATPGAQPNCLTLPEESKKLSQRNMAGVPDFDIYQATGIKTDHNKFNRASVNDTVITRGALSDVEFDTIEAMLGDLTGTPGRDVPDLVTLFASSILDTGVN